VDVITGLGVGIVDVDVVDVVTELIEVLLVETLVELLVETLEEVTLTVLD
jgi:hypothetical protein